MKKIMNKAEDFAKETVEGIALAHADRVAMLNDDPQILINVKPVRDGKVAIVTGGGSGHLPVFLGYVGEGMLDGCAIGNVFASPSSSKMEAMIRAVDKGSGVLLLYGNYGGDNLNFDMAAEMVDMDDIKTATVRVNDDVVSSPNDKRDKRRGVAGMVFAFKIAGAAADEGLDLDAVAAAAQKTCDNMRTIGFALSPCIVPEVGRPTFTIEDDIVEVGMGIHGEAGIDSAPMMTANELAELALEKIETDLKLNKGDRVSIMVNGLGATPLEEQYIVFRHLAKLLADREIDIYMPHIGEFATSMEMAGLSVTVLKLDDELAGWLRKPALTPFYTSENK